MPNTVKRTKKLETRRLQQVLADHSLLRFLANVNGFLLDGWRVVPGSYYHTRVEVVPDERTPGRYIGPHGMTYRDHYFIAIERDEIVDPDAARKIIERVEGRAVPELLPASAPN